ncbi:hypothetical protein EHI47_01770 [Rhizobium leguminosarum]|uniref:Uncharacterized protein n=1 Tax=Rhizobium leguminosarum TaxID=384 RepID=A0A444ICG1_RHILE|nr:hypothetical protein [Rhizobium leguminosarum]RWX36999.1 hypothetical protein EHI47_01770 [Rhizobium leguminosarum]
MWLKQGDLVIDITGDQFGDWPHGPVFVGKECSWLAAFSGVASGLADYRQLGGSLEVELDASYAALIAAAT